GCDRRILDVSQSHSAGRGHPVFRWRAQNPLSHRRGQALRARCDALPLCPPAIVPESRIMTSRSIVHASFTITRVYDAPPARVFQAFADERSKQKWFGGPGNWTLFKRAFDFREGGHEHLSGRHEGGTVHAFDCIYHDIVENERIVYSYVMHLDGRKISVSQ